MRAALNKRAARQALTALFLAVVFGLYAWQITAHEDARNSNYAKFWIAGHMIATGANPYDAAQWHDEHMRIGASSVPDAIFLYPLPQAFLLVPLAWLPLAWSFVFWVLASQAIIALVCYWLLNLAAAASVRKWFLPLVLLLLLFGPVYLTLKIGSIGAIALLAVVAALLLLSHSRNLSAGLLLSLLILKPSQGLPILLLAGAWFLFKRNHRAISGMLAGGVLLLVSGLLYDPQWVQKFLENSQVVSARTLGAQSNVFSLAYLACGNGAACGRIAGALGAAVILGAGLFYLWRKRAALSAWDAFSFIIPISFLSTVYLWSYDQVLYIVPIVWIMSTLAQRQRSPLRAVAFLLLLDAVAFAALGVQAATLQDRVSLATTLLVLGTCLWLQHSPASDGQPQDVAALHDVST